MKSTRPAVTVIMPALNEEAGIVRSLDAARVSLKAVRDSGAIGAGEILVIDDGSTDLTAELVAAQEREHPEIRLLRHGSNRGVGASVRTGLAAASGEFVLLTDSDMPVDLADLMRTLPLLNDPEVGMVAGRRSTDGGERLGRRVGTSAFDLLARLLFGSVPPDVNFPFKLLSTAYARKLALRIDGALADVELARRVLATGCRIETVPLEYRARQNGESKTFTLRVLGGLVRESVRHGRTLRRPAGPDQ